MSTTLGRKVDDDRERSILLAFQECIDKGAQRFIIGDTSHPDELEKALHLLLSDVWPRSTYRIRQVIRSGVHMRFISLIQPNHQQPIGEWNGNRQHGVVFVDAIRDLRRSGQKSS